MNFPEEVQKVIDLISRNQLDAVKAAIDELELKPESLFGQSMVYALCAGSAGHSYLALAHLENELRLFPHNEFAKRYQTQILDKCKQHHGSERASRSKITFIVVALAGVSHFQQALEAISYQAHRNFEVLVLKRESDEELPAQPFGFPEFRYLSVSDDISAGEALMRGFEQADGDILTVVKEPSTTWSDTGLLASLELFAANDEVHFAKGEDFYVNGRGNINVFPSAKQRWFRKLLLQENNFFPPVLIVSGEGVLFRRDCVTSANVSLDARFEEAYLFDLWAQLSRRFDLHTLVIPIAGYRVPLAEKGPRVSTRYSSECLQIIHREKGVDESKIRSSLTPPPLVTFRGIGEPPPTKPEHLPKYPLPEARLAIITRTPLKISIVMPSFNQGQYIEQTVDSILSQNWPNLEFMVLDGGSTDNTLRILDKHKKHFSFFRSHPDGGQYFAVQEGLTSCSGEVMTWLNSDDLLVPSALANVADQFESRREVSWITGRQSHITLHGDLKVDARVVAYERGRYINGGFDDPFIQQEGTFWRRSLWEQAGSTLDLRWKLAADLELWVRFFRYAKLLSVKCALARFRYQPDQRSSLHMNAYYREANLICAMERTRIKAGEFTEMLPALEIGEWPAVA